MSRLQSSQYATPSVPESEILTEIVNKRGPRHKLWELTDGRLALVLTVEKCHRLDSNGNLVDLDMRPVLENGFYKIEIEGGIISVPAFSSNPVATLESTNGDFVELELTNVGGISTPTSGNCVVQNDILTWNISPHQSMYLIPWADTFRIFRKLNNSQAAKDWTWNYITHDENLLKTEFAIGSDAKGDKLELTKEELSRNTINWRGKSSQQISIKETWTGKAANIIDKKTRQRDWGDPEFPVKVDPSVIVNPTSGSFDGGGFNMITSAYNGGNFRHNNTNIPSTNIGKNFGGATTTWYSAGFAFEPSLPNGAIINSAQLSFDFVGHSGTSVIPFLMQADVKTTGDPWLPYGSDQFCLQQMDSGALQITTTFSGSTTGIRGYDVLDIVKDAIGTTVSPSFSDILRIGGRGRDLTQANGQFAMALYEHTTKAAPKLTIIYTGGAAPAGDNTKLGFSNSWLVPNGFGGRKI